MPEAGWSYSQLPHHLACVAAQQAAGALTQPVCRADCDEELAAVGVGPAVGLHTGSSSKVNRLE